MTETNAPTTFLLTDVQGSTRMWQAHPDEMSAATRILDETVERVINAAAGRLIKARGEGDSHFCVFDDPKSAVIAARDLQLALSAVTWPTPEPIKVRASIHTGRVEFRETDFYGTEVNRAARIRSLGHGGQTLASRTTMALVSGYLPADVSFRDLGTHRLKDFADPEQVFQLCHAQLPSDFPPLAGLEERRHNLPMQTTSFVGRRRELEDLPNLVRLHRLVTIVGPGGSGKSRISVEAGRELLEDFGDGVWFVELAAVENQANVSRAIADVLRVPEHSEVGIDEAVVEFLKTRAALLIVDNAEHVIDAVAVLIERIMRSCEHTHVIVTTREALRLDGEHVWPLGPLPVVDIEELPPLEVLADSEAIRLFVDRARQLEPVFALSAANARPVAEICHRLDGIPLAIELATARIPSLGVERVASRLDNMFRVLTGGRRTAIPRQRTLRATIDWSYDLLDEPERRLLERLSVFVGGCTLEAAESVCSGDDLDVVDVDELVSSLVTKSLVAPDTASGEVRYRLLETVRQYAAEKLVDAGTMPALRDRHLQWFVSLAETYPPRWTTNLARPSAEVRRLWADVGNLRAAIAWAADDGHHEQALAVSLLLAVLLMSQGQRQSPEKLLLDAIEHELSPAPLAHARLLLHSLRLGVRDWTSDHLAQAVELARASGDNDAIAACLAMKGATSLAYLESDEARSAYEELLAGADRAEDNDWKAVALLGLSEFARIHGDFDESRSRVTDALELARDPCIRVEALQKAAYHLERTNDLSGASQLLEEAVELYMRTGFEQKAAWLIAEDLVVLKIKLGRTDEKRAALIRAEAIAEAGEDLSALAQVRWYRGWSELIDGRTDAARIAFGRSMGGFADLQSEGAAWDVRCALALVAVAEGDLETAAKVAREAATRPEASAGVEIQVSILLEAGDLDLAEELVGRDDLFGTGSGFNWQREVLRAWVALYRDRHRESIRSFEEIVSFLIAKQWCRALHADLLVGIAAGHLGAGDVAQAARALGASALLWNGWYYTPWSALPIADRVRDECRAALGDAELERLEDEGRALWNQDPSAFVTSGRSD